VRLRRRVGLGRRPIADPERTGDPWFRVRNSDGVYDVLSDERSAAIQFTSAK
jgi:hypothetical protein